MTAFLPDVTTDCCIDLSHNNSIPYPTEAFKQAAASGIAIIIQKATQGSGYVDITYKTRKPAADAAGLLWGAYHFCDGSDTVAQADHFLDVVGDPTGVLLCLDAERNASQVTVGDVVLIASRIYRRIGRWPVVYMGRSGPDGTGAGLPNGIIAQCPLWLPEYGTNPVCPAGWAEWKLWQYTDGTIGNPATVPGIGRCDRSRFAGSLQDLHAWFIAQTTEKASVAPPKAAPVAPAFVMPELTDIQKFLGVNADGVFGPATATALANYYS